MWLPDRCDWYCESKGIDRIGGGSLQGLAADRRFAVKTISRDWLYQDHD